MKLKIDKQFIAVRAIIKKNEKFLIIRESNKYKDGTNHGLYDFPGGKLNIGESAHKALLREVKEEAGMKVKVLQPVFVDEWYPKVHGQQFQIVGVFFMCEPIGKTIKLGSDHDEYKWITIDESKKYKLMPAVTNAFKVLNDTRLPKQKN